MPTLSDIREGVVAPVDSFTKLTGTGQGDTVQDMVVPQWANSIKHLAVCLGVDGGVGQGNALVKLSGATKYGDQILAVGAAANIGTTVAIAGAPIQMDVDIPVIPGKSLEIYGAWAGDDTGSPEFGVGVTFSEKAGNHVYVTRQGDPGTADTYATLTTENGTTAVNDHITQGKNIDQVLIAASYGTTTQEPQALYIKIVGVGGCILGNEQLFCGPSSLVSDGTLADGYIHGVMKYDIDVACTPGTVRVQAVSSGATITYDPMVAVTLAYRI